MNPICQQYAFDEDVALRAGADFPVLAPQDQVLAQGTDGRFDASDRWRMLSPSVDFAAQGVLPGHVVQLLGPAYRFRHPGEQFAVEACGPGWVQLRRKGALAGKGQPPVASGVVTGVEFLVTTLDPQLQACSFELDRRYGLSELVDGSRTVDLYDPREVRDAVVLTVLWHAYQAIARGGVPERDPYMSKAETAKTLLEELLDRAVVHWRGGAPAATLRFDTRLSR